MRKLFGLLTVLIMVAMLTASFQIVAAQDPTATPTGEDQGQQGDQQGQQQGQQTGTPGGDQQGGQQGQQQGQQDGQQSAQQGVARIRLVHLAPTVPGLSTFVNGEGSGIQVVNFGDITGWVDIPSTDFELSLSATGQPTDAAVGPVNLSFNQGQWVTIVVVGSDDGSSLRVFAISENYSAIPEGCIQVTLFNAIEGSSFDILGEGESFGAGLGFPGAGGQGNGSAPSNDCYTAMNEMQSGQQGQGNTDANQQGQTDQTGSADANQQGQGDQTGTPDANQQGQTDQTGSADASQQGNADSNMAAGSTATGLSCQEIITTGTTGNQGGQSEQGQGTEQGTDTQNNTDQTQTEGTPEATQETEDSGAEGENSGTDAGTANADANQTQGTMGNQFNNCAYSFLIPTDGPGLQFFTTGTTDSPVSGVGNQGLASGTFYFVAVYGSPEAPQLVTGVVSSDQLSNQFQADQQNQQGGQQGQQDQQTGTPDANQQGGQQGGDQQQTQTATPEGGQQGSDQQQTQTATPEGGQQGGDQQQTQTATPENNGDTDG